MADDVFSFKSRNFTVKLSLDTAGRKGKSVTVLDGLPKEVVLLKALLKTLKQSCGAGGTVLTDRRDGVIEIQGDHRERISQYLEKQGVKVNVR